MKNPSSKGRLAFCIWTRRHRRDLFIQHDYCKIMIKRINCFCYCFFRSKQYNEKYLKQRAILTPLNKDAEQVNDFMFDILSGSARTYKSSDEICKSSSDNFEQEGTYPIEFLNGLTFPRFPRHELNLKEGTPIMLLRNVNPFLGTCNGT
ncbi:DNA helicase Pif1-like [Dillenia turbinata]|uniref:DNA helicase Pif1-like n=1 Tax=Dillenia turbinata TaxID=194707 RepID=A0AAN8ZDD4_9MAGN